MESKNFAILVAEDNENDALLLRRCIRKVGLTDPIHIVPDGEAVVHYLAHTLTGIDIFFRYCWCSTSKCRN